MMTKTPRLIAVGTPTDEDYLKIPLSHYREWRSDEASVRRSRARLYQLNKENVRWKWRTMYDKDTGIYRVFKFERWD